MIEEARMCACGLIMEMRFGLFHCVNCDRPQPQQGGENPRPRIPTVWDERYNDAIEKREKEWYSN